MYPDREKLGLEQSLARVWDRAESDEWPVQALVLFSSGVGAGFIVATSKFDDAGNWENGWVRLTVLAGGMLLVSFLASHFKTTTQRRLQVALLLSLLAHAALSEQLSRVRITSLVAARTLFEKPAEAPKPREVTLPEYEWRQVNKPKEFVEPIERPIEIEAPSDTNSLAMARESATAPAAERPETVEAPSIGLYRQEALEAAEAAAVRRVDEPGGIAVRRQELDLDEPGFQGQLADIDLPAPAPAEPPRSAAAPAMIEEPLPFVGTAADRLTPATIAGESPRLTSPEPASRVIDQLGIAPVLADVAGGTPLDEQFPTLPRDDATLPPPTVRIDTPDVTAAPGFAADRVAEAPELAPLVRTDAPAIGASSLVVPSRALAATDRDAGQRTVASELGRSRIEIPVRVDGPDGRGGGAMGVFAFDPLSRDLGAPDVAPPADIDLPKANQLSGEGESLVGPLPADLAALERSDLGALPRLPRGGAATNIDAEPGVGGLSDAPRAVLGLNDRLARRDVDLIGPSPGRLILERAGGLAGDASRVRDVAVPGLFQRDIGSRGDMARELGGTRESEEAVELGLDFLASVQENDGSWSLHDFGAGDDAYRQAGQAQMRSSTAGTGLALLAFLGAGYTHTDGKHQECLARALDYLLEHQREDGDLFVPQDAASNQNVWLYSHGIAAIALCEAYGMTRSEALREPAQRALDFIVFAQDPKGGGWRYSPRGESDTSVSGWQVMALKSGELAGLSVPAEVYARVSGWLDGARARDGEYVYRPGSTFAHQREPSRVMTAEALLMRQYLGWRRDNAGLAAGAERLLTELPDWDARPYDRDCYYWYYGTQVMFHLQGEAWEAWNQRLRPLLVERQAKNGPLAGSWDPAGDYPDRWGYAGGRIYVTAMHLLILEVYYRHLPLYQELDEL